LEARADDTVADVDLDGQRAQFRGIEADVHGAAVGEELAVDGGEDLGVVVLDEGLFGRSRRWRSGWINLLLDMGLREGEFGFGGIELGMIGGRWNVFGGRRGVVG
jgi:hypothetical protein